MKREHVTAIIMSGMLTFGTVSPVMAANVQRDVLNNDDNSGLVNNQALQHMSDNLCTLADQVLVAYNTMTQAEKDAIAHVNGGQSVDILDEVQMVKNSVSYSALISSISTATNDDDKHFMLSNIDDATIAKLDNLNALIRQAKGYVSNYKNYLQLKLTMSIKLIQEVLVKDRLLFTEEYLSQAKKYYDEVITLKPGVQTDQYIIGFCNEINTFYQEKENHLSTRILDEGIQAAEAFKEFLACAPDPAIASTEINYGGSGPMTYSDLVSYVKRGAISLKNSSLNYYNLSNYASLLYGNLIEAYNNVSSAILTSVSKQVQDAKYIGYNGDEKTAYENALTLYNDAMTTKNYVGLTDAAKALKKTSEDYALVAEEYAKTDGKERIDELKKHLIAIKEENDNYDEYYNDIYPVEVINTIQILETANLNTLTGRQIVDLINNAKAVVEKQTSSYSQKLNDLLSSAISMTKGANEWWTFLPETMKGKAPYAEAIKLTNDLSNVSSGVSQLSRTTNTLYDLNKLIEAYNAFSSDFKQVDGKIQTAAKATAQYVYDSVENIYNEEVKKNYTATLLKAFRIAIDELKASIEAWNYDVTRVAVKKVKIAEANLLDENPQQQPTIVDTTTKVKEPNNTTAKKTTNTSDNTDTTRIGLLGILSVSGIAGIFILKRRKQKKDIV